MEQPKINFYGIDIDTPLSLSHNTYEWERSLIGLLHAETEGQVYIQEIEGQGLNAEYCWRVVDAYFSQEDSIMTYLRAYDLEGNMLPQATFGVNWSSVPSRISGGFQYRPAAQNRYYVPVLNSFPTFEVGGYVAQALDRSYPSEAIAFGLSKSGKQHQALVISWRLFRMGENYPNDLEMPIR